MRSQLNALNDKIEAQAAQIAALQAQLNQKTSQDDVVNLIGERAACNCGDVDDLQLTVSNPPTQPETQSIADKVHELMFALKGE